MSDQETTALIGTPSAAPTATSTLESTSTTTYGTSSLPLTSPLPTTSTSTADIDIDVDIDIDIDIDMDPSTTVPLEPDPTNADDEPTGVDGRSGTIETLTRRLRCLFSTITWPIVPLGTIVALALLWVLYAASSLDLRRSCHHPLHWYAVASLVLVAYIPHHAQVRSSLFQYSRERDGPIRPARVRMYDQFFHTVCLLYVYTGVTLMQTCRDDLVTPENQDQFPTLPPADNMSIYSDGNNNTQEPLNVCAATCPNLYQALSVYVATLEMFTFALILPLLFLPCIYLWFLRRATAEAEAFSHLQDRMQEEDALLHNGGVTVGEIMDHMESVQLITKDKQVWIQKAPSSLSPLDTADTTPADSTSASTPHPDDGTTHSATSSTTDVNPNSMGSCDIMECCICMNEFVVQPESDVELGMTEGAGDSANPKERRVVRTHCGHIFHQENVC
eukprot:Nitzschia sp. Nitz4//scaffold166_size90379//77455//79140//NITZ4_005071-RA/size90379-processed-gene-0.48-mRNA-1//1//CDS//3329538238//1242//frame0